VRKLNNNKYQSQIQKDLNKAAIKTMAHTDALKYARWKKVARNAVRTR